MCYVSLVIGLGLMVQPSSGAMQLANPVRKVISMLQSMQTKVEEEGKLELSLYEKFMCYCKTGGSDLSASIKEAEAKGPAVTSEIEASEGQLTQAKEDLKQAQVDRTTAKKDIAEAQVIREKEKTAYAKEAKGYEANLAAINKAIAALEKGMAGSFLQTGAAQVLRRLALDKQEMLDVDRQELLSFLSGQQHSGYAPKSGEVTGILKEMGSTMQKNLDDATATEQAAIKSTDGLIAAKEKEVEALTATIEAKTKQIGELGVAIVQMKEDLSDTAAGLEEDKKFFAQLDKNCKSKEGEWAERSKTRAEELVALSDTIKALNTDDALELFKKTLPSASASFMQVQLNASEMQVRALATIRAAKQKVDRKDLAGLDLLVLALSGKRSLNRGGFDQVIKMCDDMVEVLKKEQVDDDNKKEYCAQQLDAAEEKHKELERIVSDTEKEIEAAKEGIATLGEEIIALEKGIKALDKSVAQATEQRKEEHVEYQELMASDTAAKELLSFAKNRLNKFYNPKLYQPAPEEKLSESDQIYVNYGGTVFAQIASHSKHEDIPSPPPETWDAYAKKSEESAGVIGMIDLLIKDLDKELTEAKAEENTAQEDYEAMMQDSAEKRTVDSKALSQKISTKADMEGELEEHIGLKDTTTKELMATLEYTQSIHNECDWLLQYYDMRKEARAGEIDALEKAKAVLSGADYSLLQVKGLRRRLK